MLKNIKHVTTIKLTLAVKNAQIKFACEFEMR
jgi:hypothetical protein